jgi:signal peptidase I
VLFWVAVVCAALVGGVLIFFEPWTVPADDAQLGASIEPTLSVGDVILVTRGSGASDGALVRCADPDAAGRYVVARVVAHTGDTVEFSNGLMLLNGKTPSASAACDPAIVRIKNPANQEDEELACSLEDLGGGLHPALRAQKGATRDSKAEVEPGKVYLVSDNRVMHLDSREVGMVAPSSCHHVALRLWSSAGWSDSKKRLTVLW